MSILVDGETKMGTVKGIIFTFVVFILGLICILLMK
jgi:hypothetical protein